MFFITLHPFIHLIFFSARPEERPDPASGMGAPPRSGILRTPTRVSFGGSPAPAAFATPSFATPPMPDLSSAHTQVPASPAPPSSSYRHRSKKVRVNKHKSELQKLIICPKSVQIGTDIILPVTVILPHRLQTADEVTVSIQNLKVFIVFTIPMGLRKPAKMCPNDATKNDPKNKEGVTHNACFKHLQGRVKSKDDPIQYRLVLDLPFRVEPLLASHLIRRDSGNRAGVYTNIYAGPTFDDLPQYQQYGRPSDLLNTLTLLFKKVDEGFGADAKVKSARELASDDDGSFGW